MKGDCTEQLDKCLKDSHQKLNCIDFYKQLPHTWNVWLSDLWRKVEIPFENESMQLFLLTFKGLGTGDTLSEVCPIQMISLTSLSLLCQQKGFCLWLSDSFQLLECKLWYQFTSPGSLCDAALYLWDCDKNMILRIFISE